MQPSDNGLLPKARTEAFSDGVIAIIVTILVLEIKVPKLAGDDLEQQLLAALWHALPLVGAYVVSFMVLLVFWVAHHQLLHSLRGVDRNTLWLNGVFLMILAFVPAPTALVGEYPSARAATLIYGLVLALAGLCFSALRIHVTHRAMLLHASIPAEVARRAVLRGLLSPLLYGIGALLSLASLPAAWCMYALVPLLYILPGAFERHARA